MNTKELENRVDEKTCTCAYKNLDYLKRLFVYNVKPGKMDIQPDTVTVKWL